MRHLSGGSTCSVRSRNPIRDAESANDGGRGGRGNTQSGEMSPAAAPVLNFSLDPYAPVPDKGRGRRDDTKKKDAGLKPGPPQSH